MALFPKFSARAELTFGFGQIVMADRDVGRGVMPRWQTDDVIVYGNADGPGLWQVGRSGEPQPIYGGRVSLVAAGGGRWAVWDPDRGIVNETGLVSFDGFVPAMNRAGELAYLSDRQESRQRVLLEGLLIDAGAACYDPSLGTDGLAWSRETVPGAPRNTFGWRPGQRIQRLQASYSPEFEPVVVDTPIGPWILAHDLVPRLVLYPWGETVGYVVRVGETFNPDAVWTPNGIRIVWTTRRDQIELVTIELGAERTDLSVEPRPEPPAPDPPAPPTPEPPGPQPEPPMPDLHISDPEYANAGGRIEHHYDKHPDRYPTTREVRTDPLSYRWMVDYYGLRRDGKDHETAIRILENRMADAAGLEKPWPDLDPQ